MIFTKAVFLQCGYLCLSLLFQILHLHMKKSRSSSALYRLRRITNSLHVNATEPKFVIILFYISVNIEKSKPVENFHNNLFEPNRRY